MFKTPLAEETRLLKRYEVWCASNTGRFKVRNVRLWRGLLGGHQSAVLTMDTYADLFPDDLELVSAALDKARQAALHGTADQLRTETEKGPDQNR